MEDKKYIIKVDPSIKDEVGGYFFKRVQEILAMDCKWRGYNFIYVGTDDGWKNPEGTPIITNYDILITLLSRAKKHELLKQTSAETVDQPQKDGFGKEINFEKTEFSYTFYSNPKLIVIDEINWNTAHVKLEIDKISYEQYVIFHEIGHAIGFNHKPIPTDINKPYPIMYQATLGIPDKKRFFPYPTATDYE